MHKTHDTILKLSGAANHSARFQIMFLAVREGKALVILTMDPSRATDSERTAVPTSGTSSQLHAPAVRSHTLMLPRLSPALTMAAAEAIAWWVLMHSHA